MLGVGLFAGIWWHNSSGVGSDWQSTVTRCAALTGETFDVPSAASTTELPVNAEFQRCTQSAERQRALYGLAGAVTLSGSALLIAAFVPEAIKRRKRLQPMPAKVQGAANLFRQYAVEAGLRRTPELWLGPATQRDAFSFGLPGRYGVALPPKLVGQWAHPVFESAVRHELAHIAHRDVPFAWIAITGNYVLLAMIGVPLAVDLVSGDVGFAAEYGVRGAIVGIAVVVARRSWLRSREYDADQRASRRMADPEMLARVLDGSAPQAPAPSLWRRLLAFHPSLGDRAAAVRAPERIASVGFSEGFTASFFGALFLPMAHTVLVAWFNGTGTGHFDAVELVSALLAGLLVGGTLGLDLWRQSLITRVTGGPLRRWPVAAGAGSGMILGLLASLGDITDRTELGERLAACALPAIALAGAAVISAGMGDLWANAAARMRSSVVSWLAAFTFGSVSIAAAYWVASYVVLASDENPAVLSETIFLRFSTWPGWVSVSIVFAGLLLPGLISHATSTQAPHWLAGKGSAVPWPPRPWLRRATVCGFSAGLAGGAAITVYRLAIGPADAVTAEERFYLNIAAASLAGLIALFVVHFSWSSSSSVGAGLFASFLALSIALLVYVGINPVLGGSLNLPFVLRVMAIGYGPHLVGVLFTVWVLAFAGRTSWRWPVLTSGVVCFVAAAAVSGGILVTRPPIVPWTATASPLVPSSPAPAASERDLYLTKVGPLITAGFTLAVDQLSLIEHSGEAAQAQAAQLSQQVIPALTSLAKEADSFRFKDPDVAEVHDAGRRAIHAALEAVTAKVKYLQTTDSDARQQSLESASAASSAWRSYQARLSILGVS